MRNWTGRSHPRSRIPQTIRRSRCRRRTGANCCASLARLSPEHSEVIDLVYYYGKSVKEVADIVGVGEATVKTRMFYARKRLAVLVSAS
jgi:RNA polymerase sigma-70 factor, ECF subfamily